jgi:hypothetical protein
MKQHFGLNTVLFFIVYMTGIFTLNFHVSLDHLFGSFSEVIYAIMSF